MLLRLLGLALAVHRALAGYGHARLGAHKVASAVCAATDVPLTWLPLEDEQVLILPNGCYAVIHEDEGVALSEEAFAIVVARLVAGINEAAQR